MGWNFRRSINVGPFRMNFSKSGIGYSAGIRGARIGRDAKGRKYTQLSIPHTGIYRRDYYDGAKGSASTPPQQPFQAPSPQRAVQPGIQLRSIVRSPFVLYGGGGLLLYALIRAIF